MLLHEIADLKTCLSSMTAPDPVTLQHVFEDKSSKCSYAQAVVPTDQTLTPWLPQKPHSDPQKKFHLIIQGLEESTQKLFSTG